MYPTNQDRWRANSSGHVYPAPTLTIATVRGMASVVGGPVLALNVSVGIFFQRTAAAVSIAVAVVLPGCGHTVTGTAVPGPRTSVSHSVNIDADVDTVSVAVKAFWRTQGVDADYVLTPVAEVACAGSASPEPSLFCRDADQNQVRYSPPALQRLRRDGGAFAVELTLAQDIGQAAQNSAGKWTAYPDPLARLRSADCASGAYMRFAHPGDLAEVQHAVSFTWINTEVLRLAAFLRGLRGEIAPTECLNYTG